MKITLIGCGWLGLPLAIELLKEEYTVFGSTTSEEKRSTLEHLGIQSFLYDGNIHSSIPENCVDAHICIINFPSSKSKNYSMQIQKLLQSFSSSCKIIFTSSTGVYEDSVGEITETAACKLEHPVYLAEGIIRANNKENTILRLAGLIGENRHPVKFLSNKILPDGNVPVNIVHQKDVIRAILSVINQNAWGKTYTICNPEHPSKSEYYCKAARTFNLEEPKYLPSESNGKIVSGALFQKELSFNYLFDI